MVGILNLGHYDSIIYLLWDLSSPANWRGLNLFILTCIRHLLQAKHSGRSEAEETRQGPCPQGAYSLVRVREPYSCLGLDMYTPLCLKWIPNKDLPYSTWNSAECYVAAWMQGEFRG